MPKLLVSVRSVREAQDALVGGASIIDVKEPTRGPLGRADADVWKAIQALMPAGVGLSVALGELTEWQDKSTGLEQFDFAGISYRKIGLAGAGPSWRSDWSALRLAWRDRVPAWVAVIYSDWELAGAPHPTEVLVEALAVPNCTGLLVDTWDKLRPSTVDRRWLPWVSEARRGGLTIALAGGLDEAQIERLAPLEPDWFAVRGAACHQGERGGTIDPARVVRLARLVERLS